MAVTTMPPPSRPAPERDRPAARFTPPDLVDLRTAWTRERELATCPGARHDAAPVARCPGRHGRLLDDGLDELLDPVLGPNATPGYYPFRDLGAHTAAGLLGRLDPEVLASERQNLGPTLGTVLRAVVRHPDRLLAEGYVIGPLRCDERVTVTAVLLRTDRPLRIERRHDDGCECDDVLRTLTALGVDDMDAPPDEITPCWGPACLATPPGAEGADDDEPWYRAWWD
ncbi:hypothetical protein [Isoptericola sp. NPDC057191]|uniref:hypothetical protein n=1 Tax=Isoptericola sp. NPDC057191 TaxID=3346041 RepID=UPI00362C4404